MAAAAPAKRRRTAADTDISRATVFDVDKRLYIVEGRLSSTSLYRQLLGASECGFDGHLPTWASFIKIFSDELTAASVAAPAPVRLLAGDLDAFADNMTEVSALLASGGMQGAAADEINPLTVTGVSITLFAFSHWFTGPSLSSFTNRTSSALSPL